MACRNDVGKIIEEMDKKIRLPGVANAWTMPIKNRLDMLSTGVRSSVGIKISGPDLTKIEEIGRRLKRSSIRFREPVRSSPNGWWAAIISTLILSARRSPVTG